MRNYSVVANIANCTEQLGARVQLGLYQCTAGRRILDLTKTFSTLLLISATKSFIIKENIKKEQELCNLNSVTQSYVAA
jgi:hypothetical protein